MASDVKITITMVKPIGNIGFGCPLILEENATAAKDFAKYSSLSDLVTAGYTTESKVYKAAQLMFMQDHAPNEIAVCSATTAAETWLAVEDNVSKSWRQLVVINSSASADTTTNVAGIMAAIEAQTTYPKMYYANLDYDDETELTVTGIERTVLCYYTPTEDIPVPVAALAGEIGGLTVGSYTINNMIIKGVPGMELSQQEIEAIHDKGGITFVLSAGDVVMSEGHSAGGVFVDQTDGNDYIKQQLEYKTQKVFNNNLKVPYTNAGIAMLEAAAIDVMTDAQNKTIVESFTVAYGLRENTTAADRAARRYVDGNISYIMAGAIHTIEIACEVSI